MTEWSASSGSPLARRLVAVAEGAAGVAAGVGAEAAGAAKATGAAWAAGAAGAREAAEEVGAAEGGGTGGATWGGGNGEVGEGGGAGGAGEARVAAVVPVVTGRAAVASAAPAPRRWNSGMGCRRAVLAGDPPAEAAENDSAWMAATSGGGPSAATGVEGRGGNTVGRAVARAGSAASWGRSAPSGSQTAGRFDIALRPLFFFFFFIFFFLYFFLVSGQGTNRTRRGRERSLQSRARTVTDAMESGRKLRKQKSY